MWRWKSEYSSVAFTPFHWCVWSQVCRVLVMKHCSCPKPEVKYNSFPAKLWIGSFHYPSVCVCASFLPVESLCILSHVGWLHVCMWNKKTDTHQHPVNHSLIKYCWDGHSSAKGSKRKSFRKTDGDWMEQEESKWTRGKTPGGRWTERARQKSQIDISCLWKARIRFCLEVYWRHLLVHFPNMVTVLPHWLYICYQQPYPTRSWISTIILCCVKAISGSGGKCCYL